MNENEIVLNAPAKLNLSLKVVGKKDDGYHLISSHVIFLDLKDFIILKKAKENNVFISGPMSKKISLKNNENLAIKALKLMQEKAFANEFYNIYLEKNIPVAAGLGGGSADAAAIIRYFIRKIPVGETKKKRALLLSLGSDVPACYYSKPMQISGVGENINIIRNYNKKHLTEIGIVLVNPNISISTKEVFSKLKFDPKKKSFPIISNLNSLDGALKALQYGNDLLHVTREICPEISKILTHLNNLQGCRGVGMSGSGPTCFALFDCKSIALSAINEIHVKNLFEKSWTWCGGLYNQNINF